MVFKSMIFIGLYFEGTSLPVNLTVKFEHHFKDKVAAYCLVTEIDCGRMHQTHKFCAAVQFLDHILGNQNHFHDLF